MTAIRNFQIPEIENLLLIVVLNNWQKAAKVTIFIIIKYHSISICVKQA